MRMLSVLARPRAIKTAIVLAIAGTAAAPSFAATTISSSGTALSVNLNVASIIGASVPLAAVSGTGPGSYTKSNTLASVDQSLGLGTIAQSVNTGLLSASASSNGTTGTGSSSVNNLSLGLGGILSSLLGINAGVLGSTTSWNGTSFTGTSTITGLSIGSSLLNTLGLGITVPANVAANTVLFDGLGLKIVANEQIETLNNIGSVIQRSYTTNALRVNLNAFGLNAVNGDIVVGQSNVTVAQAVPEPATWAMMILGFGAIGFAMRSSRRNTMVTFARG